MVDLVLGDPVKIMSSVGLTSPTANFPMRFRETKEPELAWVVQIEESQTTVQVLTCCDSKMWWVKRDCIYKII